MNLRRVFSLILLLAATASIVEPVIGEARDAGVHHEEQVTVPSRHMVHSPAGHAHEGPAPSPHSKSDSHRHGSSSDHCTHQHGPGMPTRVALVFIAPLGALTVPDQHHPVGRTVRPLFHPPQA